MSPRFASFRESEHRERLARARKKLQERGLGFCIAVAPESLYYLVGYDSWVGMNSPQALVFGVNEDEEGQTYDVLA